MSEDRVWLTHPEHGGHFECPAGAVEAWTSPELGWVPAESAPEEHNPVIAEALAARAEAERVTAEEQKKPRKAAKAAADNTQEG